VKCYHHKPLDASCENNNGLDLCFKYLSISLKGCVTMSVERKSYTNDVKIVNFIELLSGKQYTAGVGTVFLPFIPLLLVKLITP